MYNVIIILVAVAFMLYKAKEKRDQEEKRTSENGEQENVSQAANTIKSVLASFRGEIPNQTTSNIRVNEKQKESKKRTTNTYKQTLSSQAQVNTNDTQREGEAVTDYLSRRSHEEEVTRKKEEWEERREEQKNSGDLRMAKRLTFGEAVPPGNELVICSYCGAENLVAKMSNEKQHCYFCRSSLPRNINNGGY